MIRCSCNRLTDQDFARAIEAKAAAIESSATVREASAAVFRHARDAGGHKAACCTNCVTGVIPVLLKQAGHFPAKP